MIAYGKWLDASKSSFVLKSSFVSVLCRYDKAEPLYVRAYQIRLKVGKLCFVYSSFSVSCSSVVEHLGQ